MSSHFDGFVPIHCVFYSVFHPTEGTKVRHEFPPGCLESSGINFDTIKNYVIPKPQLCNKLLTFKYGPYRLVCYPVNVNASFYARNSFSFNFVFVFPYDCATSPYEPAIARLGKMFRVLEEQSQVLSKAEESTVYYHLKTMDSSTQPEQDNLSEVEPLNSKTEDQDPHQSKNGGHAFEKYHEILKDLKNSNRRLSIEDLITKIYQDLNNYSECLIPIDSGNSVDIKLFPLLSPPNSCFSFEDVPIATVNLAKLIDVNWDPTMLKIVPFINGINSVAKIAKFSDSDVNLVIECTKHLIYYNCVVLADIFQFSNIYAPTSQLSRFLTDPSLATACQVYVTSDDCSDFVTLPFDKKHQSRPISRKQHSNNTIETLRRRSSTRGSSLNSGVDSPSHKHLLSSSSQSSLVPGQNISETSLATFTSGPGKAAPFIAKSCLFDLYRSLSQGQSVKEWFRLNFEKIREGRIDVRRFITFGVIHGLVYRCYSYPVMKNIGTLDMVRMLNSTEEANALKSKWKLREKNITNNVLSTADIRVGLEHKLKNETRGSLKSYSNVDIADEVLKDVYKKLAISDTMDETVFQSHNPISKIYGDVSEQSSINTPRKESSSSAGSDGRNRVSFEVRKSPRPLISDDRIKAEVMDVMREKRREEFLLLKSVKSVETLDKICMRLQKDREEVETLLKDMGHYSIINS